MVLSCANLISHLEQTRTLKTTMSFILELVNRINRISECSQRILRAKLLTFKYHTKVSQQDHQGQKGLIPVTEPQTWITTSQSNWLTCLEDIPKMQEFKLLDLFTVKDSPSSYSKLIFHWEETKLNTSRIIWAACWNQTSLWTQPTVKIEMNLKKGCEKLHSLSALL